LYITHLAQFHWDLFAVTLRGQLSPLPSPPATLAAPHFPDWFPFDQETHSRASR
jgi:hypothetical protein